MRAGVRTIWALVVEELFSKDWTGTLRSVPTSAAMPLSMEKE